MRPERRGHLPSLDFFGSFSRPGAQTKIEKAKARLPTSPQTPHQPALDKLRLIVYLARFIALLWPTRTCLLFGSFYISIWAMFGYGYLDHIFEKLYTAVLGESAYASLYLTRCSI